MVRASDSDKGDKGKTGEKARAGEKGKAGSGPAASKSPRTSKQAGGKPAAKKTAAPGSATGANAAPGRHAFQAEVARLLHLMVHSVYSETEIFLRELISNAADACDKLRYQAITSPALLKDDPDLVIKVTADPTARILTIEDNGIGMSHDEMVDNLGTIARSGTFAFMEAAQGAQMGKGKEKAATQKAQKAKKPNDKARKGESDNLSLIGRFGVGFYSAFMVADKVEVVSARAGESGCWRWTSKGEGEFETEAVRPGDDFARPRGTLIRLHVKDSAGEFLDDHRLEGIIKAYSDHVSFPILLKTLGAKDGEKEDGDAEARQVNEAGALWARPKSEISKEQYREFYGHVAHQFDEPALCVHYHAEGRHEYTVLLFVPGGKPFDLFDPNRAGCIRLYVKRVFITEEAELLPRYLRFVRGVVDSQDMPLNISREMLQNNPLVAQIRKALANRMISELTKLADKEPDAFAKIWDDFGAVLKEGLYEDMERRDQLLELVRFNTTADAKALRSLKDYVGALKDNQTAIYYVAGEAAGTVARSPQLEGFRARGIEVLLLSDPVDHFWVTNVSGYDGKPFRSVTQGAADLDLIAPEESDGGKAAIDDAGLAALMAAMKQALGDAVADVKRSERLTDSPACLVAAAGAPDRGLERMLARQSGAGETPRVLELNPRHAVIAGLADAAASPAKAEKARLEDAAWLIFDQARLLEGETLKDPHGFSARLMRLMGSGLKGK